jgi:hypothetical protein
MAACQRAGRLTQAFWNEEFTDEEKEMHAFEDRLKAIMAKRSE